MGEQKRGKERKRKKTRAETEKAEKRDRKEKKDRLILYSSQDNYERPVRLAVLTGHESAKSP